MSPHVYVTKRKSKRGESRYVVRYRWGGRGFNLIHLASKRTQREARALRDWARRGNLRQRAIRERRFVAPP